MNDIHNKDSVAHSDIKADSFIIRLAPPAWHPYLKLARVDRPVGVWLLLFPGLWGLVLAAGSPLSPSFEMRHWGLAAIFILGSFLMRAAGCVINDLWDRHLDAKVERTRPRPLASGELNVPQALAFLFFLLSVSFALLLLLNTFTVILGLIVIIPIIVYPLMKRITWWPQAFLGLTFNWGALMGWSAVKGNLEFAAFALYAACIFWTLAYDTIYAHQDKDDDARIGIKSTALLLGEKSRHWVAGFYALALGGFFIAKMFAIPSFLTPGLMIIPSIYVFQLVKSWEMNNQMDSLVKFKKNTILGLIILVIFCL